MGMEVAASSLVASPTITASHSLTNGAYGFDLDASNYAVVSTDSACWIQIDYGAPISIYAIRFRSGPDTAGTQAQTLVVSNDATAWTTIASWAGQTYYSALSEWFYVRGCYRYIRITKANPNYMRTYYMGVRFFHTYLLSSRRDRLYPSAVSGGARPDKTFATMVTARHNRLQTFGVSRQAAKTGINTYGSDILTGGTASASTTQSGYSPGGAVDDNTSTRWNNNNALPSWWKYDLGAGVSKCVRKLRLYKVSYDQLKDFTLRGSNNDSDWTDIYSDTMPTGLGVWRSWTFENTNSYRYYLLYLPTSWSGTWVSIGECEMLELLF